MRLLNASVTPLVGVRPITDPRMGLYEVRGRYFAYDVNSMAVVQLDHREQIKELQATRHAPYVNACYKSSIPGPNKFTKPVSIVLHTTQTCNLNCSYCFLEHEYIDGLLDTRKGRMTFAVAKKAIDELLTTEHHPQVGFFGGEPTLNWDLMVKVTEYLKDRASVMGKQPGFSVTTNGTTLTEERIRFLADNHYGMIISIDGTRESHDTNRPHALPPIAAAKGKKAKGSYDKVMETLRLIKSVAPQLSKRITLRGTFPWSGRKSSLLEDTRALNDLVDQGLAGWCSIEPAILTEKNCAVGSTGQLTFTPEKVFEMYEEYLEVADWMVERLKAGKPARFHQISKFVERTLHGIHAWSECGAGVGYMSVDAAGAVYACHRQQHSYIGNLYDGGVNEDLRGKWLDNRTVARPHCQACNLQYVCGGGCREESIGYHVSHNGMTPEQAIFQNYQVMCNFKECWFAAALWVMSEVDRRILAKAIKNPMQNQLNAIHQEHQRREGFRISGPTNRVVKTCETCDVC